jgi:hypothetical protein
VAAIKKSRHAKTEKFKKMKEGAQGSAEAGAAQV